MKRDSAIIDTNLIFSALISSNSTIRETLLSNNYNFYAPNYLMVEIFKHKEKVLKNSKLNDDELYFFFGSILEKINFVPISIISNEHKQLAYDYCKDIDLKDIPFVALSLHLSAPLWTGDKKLTQELIKKGFDQFFKTD